MKRIELDGVTLLVPETPNDREDLEQRRRDAELDPGMEHAMHAGEPHKEKL